MRCYDSSKFIGREGYKGNPRNVYFMAKSEEMQVFWQWFRGWDAEERRIFLEKLLPKVTPNKLFAMVELAGIHSTRPPESLRDCRTFGDRLKYFHSRLDHWSAEEANGFLSGLEEIDESVMGEFYAKIASTAKEP